MEIKKHTVRFKNSAVRISSITRVMWDSCDSTVKFYLIGGESTCWVGCSRKEYEQLIDIWEEYLEKTISVQEKVTKTVN